MPVFIIRTAQRQTAFNEYRLNAANKESAEGKVKAGEASGTTYETDYDTEVIESCEEESAIG